MTFPQGVDFRGSTPFVTDPTNFTDDISQSPDYPVTSPQGNSIGWTSTTALNTRDRNAGNDPRLAGCSFDVAAQFKVTLPAAGTYTLNLGVGDSYGRSNQKVEVFDGATSLGVLFTGASSGSGNTFLDAAGNVWSAAAWPGSNVGVNFTFTTTSAIVAIGDGTNDTFIATLEWTAAAGGGVSASLAETFGDFTSAGTAAVPVAATSAVTFGDFTSVGTATVPVHATGAVTFGDFTSVGTATVPVHATGAVTFGDFTMVGTASVVSGIVASANVTFSDFTMIGSAKVGVAGSSAVAFGDFTSVGTATVTASAGMTVTFPDFTMVGSASVLGAVSATLSETFGNFTMVGLALVPQPPGLPYVISYNDAMAALASSHQTGSLTDGQYYQAVYALQWAWSGLNTWSDVLQAYPQGKVVQPEGFTFPKPSPILNSTSYPVDAGTLLGTFRALQSQGVLASAPVPPSWVWTYLGYSYGGSF